MKVVFSNAAELDLEEIGDGIARDNSSRALTFVRELRAVALRLRDMPSAFRWFRVMSIAASGFECPAIT